MRSDKLNKFLFFFLTLLSVALGMFLINRYAKDLLNIYSFPQSNTIPYLQGYFKLPTIVREYILQTTMAINLALMLTSYASFFIYLYFWDYRKLLNKRFGLIYDITTNQPVPFAVVRLFEKKSSKVLRQTVTDIYGRYEMITDLGSHRMTVEHDGYEMFAQDLKSISNDQQITLNIAISPAKTGIGILDLIFKRFLSSFNSSTPKFGFIVTAILLVFSLNPVNLVILLVLAFQLMFHRNTWETRNWGSVYEVGSEKRLKGAFVSVFNITDHRQVGSQMTDEKGRYGFILEEKSQYLVKVSLPGYRVTTINQQLESETLASGEYAIRLPSGKVNDLDIGMELMYVDPSKKAFT